MNHALVILSLYTMHWLSLDLDMSCCVELATNVTRLWNLKLVQYVAQSVFKELTSNENFELMLQTIWLHTIAPLLILQNEPRILKKKKRREIGRHDSSVVVVAVVILYIQWMIKLGTFDILLRVLIIKPSLTVPLLILLNELRIRSLCKASQLVIIGS